MGTAGRLPRRRTHRRLVAAGAAAAVMLAAGPSPLAPAAPPSHDSRAGARTVDALAMPWSDAFTNGEATMGVPPDWDEAARTLAPRPFAEGPVHEVCGQPVDRSVWYRLRSSTEMTVDVDTFGSGFDTVLAVWLTNARGELAPAPLVCNDDADGGRLRQSEVAGLALTAGVTYYVQVMGWREQRGPGALNVRPVSGRIEGRVGGDDGAAAASACLTAWRDGQPAGAAVADGAGHYRLVVAPGTVTVEASDCGERRFRARWYGGSPTAVGATAVVVDRAAVVGGVDITVPWRPPIPAPAAHDHREAAAKISLLPHGARVSTHRATREPGVGEAALDQLSRAFTEHQLDDPVPAGARDRLLGEPDPACTGGERIVHTLWYRFRPNGSRPVGVTASDPEGEHLPVVAIWRVDDAHDRSPTRIGDAGMVEMACARGTASQPAVTATATLEAGRLYFVQVGSRPAGEAPYAGGYLDLDIR